MSNKKKRALVVIVVLTALIVFVLWLRLRMLPPVAGPADNAAPATTAATLPPGSTPLATGGARNTPLVTAKEAEEKRGRELLQTFQTLNDNPIDFYGRALDQFGAPVTGANVTGIVLFNTGTQSGQHRSQTVTDGQGYFQFVGLRGQDIGIGIEKEGYEYHPRTTSFSYSYFEADHKRHVPDPKNPVIFPLWKKQGAEALVHYDRTWRFPVNGGPIRIDLVTGRIGKPDADLIVDVSRMPLRMPYGEVGFAWEATVDVVGGGLVRTGEHDYYNIAPESGYGPRFEYVQAYQNVHESQTNNTKWTWREDVTGDFFLSSRNGKNFARVSLRIRPNVDRKEGDNESLVAAEVWLNPNGSRNLEFDPKKAILPAP